MKVEAKIILTFLVSGKQFFMADFLQKSPKVGFFNSSPQPKKSGKSAGLKSHLTCEFVIFGLLTRSDWLMAVSDGIKNGQ